MDETFLERPDFEGAKYVYTPPPRAKENQEHLWHAVSTDILSVISTDHCPFRWADQKSLGKDDFSKIPNGGPGLEDRLMMIHEFGVRGGRITLNRMVELLSTNPAKFSASTRARARSRSAPTPTSSSSTRRSASRSPSRRSHSRVDYNLYEGTEVTGGAGDRSRARAR